MPASTLVLLLCLAVLEALHATSNVERFFETRVERMACARNFDLVKWVFLTFVSTGRLGANRRHNQERLV